MTVKLELVKRKSSWAGKSEVTILCIYLFCQLLVQTHTRIYQWKPTMVSSQQVPVTFQGNFTHGNLGILVGLSGS